MDAPDLETILNLDKGSYVETTKITEPRLQALREAACSLGAETGSKTRSLEIRALYEKESDRLYRLYPFQSVMLEFGVMPPVITVARDSVSQVSDIEVTFAGVTYTKIADAKFVTVAPTWRDYIYRGLTFNKVEIPPVNFLPEKPEEKAVWKEEVARCYKKGLEQANAVLEINRADLRRDFKGMLQYKLLALKGEITAPVVLTSNSGVERSSGEKRLDVRRYTIKQGSGF